MVKVTHKNGLVLTVNLSPEAEAKVQNAWAVFRGDPNYANKIFAFKPKCEVEGRATLKLYIHEIADIEIIQGVPTEAV